MKFKIILFLISLSNSNIVICQESVFGQVKNETSENIEFAIVLIKDFNDSSKIISATITDLNGNYNFKDNYKGKYWITASCLGYQSKTDSIDLSQAEIEKNITLKIKTTGIDEVVVQGSNLNKRINKDVYYITSTDIKNANNVTGIVEKIPKLNYNMLENQITTVHNEQVKLLINGMNADDKDMLAINPRQVLKIEYYDIPPARYANAGYGAVINIITKKSIQGTSGTINLQNAFLTGFGNDYLNLKYNKKRSEFGLSYYFSYRDYSSRTVDEELQYSLDSTYYNKVISGVESPMDYYFNIIDLSYLYHKDSSLTLRIKVSPNFSTSKRLDQQIFNYSLSENNSSGFVFTNNNRTDFKPVIDLYLNKVLKNDQQLFFNIVSTQFFTDYYNERIELSEAQDTLFYFDNNTNNRKQSIISEIQYEKRFEIFDFSIGGRNTIAKAEQDVVSNLSDESFIYRTIENYIYFEIIGDLKKLKYSLNFGITNNSYLEKQNNYNFNSFGIRSNIIISYPICEKGQVKAKYIHQPIIPQLPELSQNSFFIDEHIIRQGNPEIKPYALNTYTIEYSFNSPRIKISPELTIKTAKNPIYSSFSISDDLIYNVSENHEWKENYYVGLSFSYVPFKNNLLSLDSYFEYYVMKHDQLEQSNEQCNGFNYSATINIDYKILHCKLGYYSPIKNLDGPYIITSAAYSYFESGLQFKAFSLGLAIYYPFSSSWYSIKETFTNNIINDKKEYRIYDNGNMIVLKASYSFSSGKKYKAERKKLKNNDYDSGVFTVE